jgi:hypothetical protein
VKSVFVFSLDRASKLLTARLRCITFDVMMHDAQKIFRLPADDAAWLSDMARRYSLSEATILRAGVSVVRRVVEFMSVCDAARSGLREGTLSSEDAVRMAGYLERGSSEVPGWIAELRSQSNSADAG